MPNEIPLQFVDVTKNYGELCAVDHVSFTVARGEVFGLLGPNGAGKTTSISMITTVEAPTSGDIQVFGTSVLKDPIGCKRQFGIVPQENISHGFFDVWEVLGFHSGFYGVSGNEKWLEHLLRRVGLWRHRHKRVSQLSGGMKKRLAIVKALVHKPPLLLLDEPTAGVDIELRDTLWDFVNELRDQGTTILLTTHYLQEAELLCDRVAIIDQGSVKKLDETRKLVKELTSREISITFKGPVPDTVDGSYIATKEGSTALFRIPHSLDFAGLVENSGISPSQIQDIQIREGSLEDVVRQLVTFDAHGEEG